MKKLLVCLFSLFSIAATATEWTHSTPFCRSSFFKILGIPQTSTALTVDKVFTGTQKDGKPCKITLKFYRSTLADPGKVYPAQVPPIWFPFNHWVETKVGPECAQPQSAIQGQITFRKDYGSQYRIYKTSLAMRARADGKTEIIYAQEEGQVWCMGIIQ